MTERQTLTDRQRGCLIGLAAGDALGAPIEGCRQGTFPEVTGYQSQPAAWTDDTSMALALADSIATVGWDLNDQATRYLAWCKGGQYSVSGMCTSIGMTTALALSRFEQIGDATRSADPSPQVSGNGSIMRLAPVPIRYNAMLSDALPDLVRRASESSLPTHASPPCLSACVYMTLMLSGLIQGLDRDTVLNPEWEPMLRARRIAPFADEIAEVAEGSFRRRKPPEIVGSGYVVKSLEAALWAFHDASDFRKAVLRAVNLGDDADTTGAVCGQLAGAYWGELGIPAEWREDWPGRT
jgi:ADP-ribosyl-[dinitrogen reductase] hydrolase